MVRGRVVHQRGPNDCGVAVVVMVAGVTYEQALAAVFPRKVPKPNQMWTSSRQLAAALKRLGIKCDERARPLFGRSYKDLEHDAILLVDRDPKTWSWHWVYWIAKSKRLYDPAIRPRKASRLRCTSFLQIYRD